MRNVLALGLLVISSGAAEGLNSWSHCRALTDVLPQPWAAARCADLR